jgi:hypothetical protein
MTAVYSVVFASIIGERGPTADRLAVAIAYNLSAIITWTIPFVFTIVLRSPVKVGFVCSTIGLMPLFALWALTSTTAIPEYINVGIYGAIFNHKSLWWLFVNALVGTAPIANSAIGFMPQEYQEPPNLYYVWLVSAIGYGLTGYLIAKSLPLRKDLLDEPSPDKAS